MYRIPMSCFASGARILDSTFDCISFEQCGTHTLRVPRDLDRGDQQSAMVRGLVLLHVKAKAQLILLVIGVERDPPFSFVPLVEDTSVMTRSNSSGKQFREIIIVERMLSVMVLLGTIRGCFASGVCSLLANDDV
eukprot:TRINITY_DN23860_c0_g1_i1.p1 TRINITY_DN23860_c0_g1~~TRINITY_DN23860_c0_g1_i1.p1  ORF type:complete len:135 (-),score=2.49 TRINITY_DN23860_c0_g1_i1:110-514(-)